MPKDLPLHLGTLLQLNANMTGHGSLGTGKFLSFFMHKLIAFLALGLSFTLVAQAGDFLRYEKKIHPSIGVLQFELIGVPAEPMSDECESCNGIDATLEISDASGKVLQRIPQKDFPVFRGWLDFLDVNGDSYVDLIVYNQPEGSGPLTHADIWIYDPRLRLFVLSKEISGRGEVKKPKRSNCISLEYKSGLMGYTSEEWCFNKAKGYWRLVRRSGREE
jgi:hypothetical protein